MNSSVTNAIPVGGQEEARSANGIYSWVTTVDHKRIGILYLLTALVFLRWPVFRRSSCAGS